MDTDKTSKQTPIYICYNGIHHYCPVLPVQVERLVRKVLVVKDQLDDVINDALDVEHLLPVGNLKDLFLHVNPVLQSVANALSGAEATTGRTQIAKVSLPPTPVKGISLPPGKKPLLARKRPGSPDPGAPVPVKKVCQMTVNWCSCGLKASEEIAKHQKSYKGLKCSKPDCGKEYQTVAAYWKHFRTIHLKRLI